MNKKLALVATTIGKGDFLYDYLKKIEEEKYPSENVAFYVIPDKKTPADVFKAAAEIGLRGIRMVCPTIEEQDHYLSRLGRIKNIIPYNSDNRRNIGYLMAVEQGAEVIISIDDDNFPSPAHDFFGEHAQVNQVVKAPSLRSSTGWFNFCDLLEVDLPTTYPRGFPYSYRHRPTSVQRQEEEGIVHLNAGLWLGHPDIDALNCLCAPAVSHSFKGESCLLDRGTWSPINTQNTAISREAMPSYYFLKMGYPILGMPIDRYGDIFSGFFIQACVKHLGYRLRVGTPICDHRRNVHNYFKDLINEIACITILEDLTLWITEQKLEGKDYFQVFLCLAGLLEDAVEGFSGLLWNDATRGYFHYMAYCMRIWVQTMKSFS